MPPLGTYLPEVDHPQGRFRLLGIILLTASVTTLYFAITDRAIQDWSVDSQILVFMVGFMISSMFFLKKKTYQEKYREKAYSFAYKRFLLPGQGISLAVLAHAAYMNGPSLPSGWWTTIMFFLGGVMLLIGGLLFLRIMSSHGLEKVAKVDVYYPEEAQESRSPLIHIIRHPVHAAYLRLGIGLALINHNAFALTFAIFLPLGLTGWVRLVEERNLIDRSGQLYVDYRRRVPAFWPKLTHLSGFLKYLISGS